MGGRLGAELVSTIPKKLGKLTLRFNMDLITELGSILEGVIVCGCCYSINEKERKKERDLEANVLNEDAQFGLRLGFVEWRLESAEFVYQTTQGPDGRFGVVRFLLRQLR